MEPVSSTPKPSTFSACRLLGAAAFRAGVTPHPLGGPCAAHGVPRTGRGGGGFPITSASLRAQGPEGRADCACFCPPTVGMACEAPESRNSPGWDHKGCQGGGARRHGGSGATCPGGRTKPRSRGLLTNQGRTHSQDRRRASSHILHHTLSHQLGLIISYRPQRNRGSESLRTGCKQPGPQEGRGWNTIEAALRPQQDHIRAKRGGLVAPGNTRGLPAPGPLVGGECRTDSEITL